MVTNQNFTTKINLFAENNFFKIIFEYKLYENSKEGNVIGYAFMLYILSKIYEKNKIK